eukprot:COSAG01_NODE_802_length_13465_cov_24.092242_2_plen_124_part_00
MKPLAWGGRRQPPVLGTRAPAHTRSRTHASAPPIIAGRRSSGASGSVAGRGSIGHPPHTACAHISPPYATTACTTPHGPCRHAGPPGAAVGRSAGASQHTDTAYIAAAAAAGGGRGSRQDDAR